MSTKGQTLSTTTREKMSLSKTKISKLHLIQSGHDYIASLFNNKQELIKPPSIVGYCLKAGISRSRLYEILPGMPELADTIEYIEMLQEQYAIYAGFTTKQGNFAQFILKSRHNYRDNPQTLTQNNTFNISPDILADALELMNKPKK